MPTHEELVQIMDRGVRDGAFPGGVLLVQRDAEVAHLSAHGRTACEPTAEPITSETCFDLASLTKVLATTSLVLLAVVRGELRLDDPVARYLTELVDDGAEAIRISQLLDHSSGLVAWRPYFAEVAAAAGGALVATTAGRDAVRSMVQAEQPEARPGSRAEYSDVGFILLDWILERACGESSDALFDERVTRPLGLERLFFIDLKDPAKAARARRGRRFAATERCPWRGRTLIGEVHDDNTYVMGGVSGHAGLFGSAEQVARLSCAWLDAWRGCDQRTGLFPSELVRRFWQRSKVPRSTRTLGFDTPASADSQAGRQLGSKAVGHLGFTGTSLWIDLERALIVVLLTNRVHPSRENEAIGAFRPALHDAVAKAFG